MSKITIILILTTLFFACNNDSPAERVPLNSVLSITNNHGSSWYVKIGESNTATEVLTIENVATLLTLDSGETITWDITWTGVSGVNQFVYAEIYDNNTAIPPTTWNGDLEIIPGQIVSLDLTPNYVP